jgi:hypothetical protein
MQGISVLSIQEYNELCTKSILSREEKLQKKVTARRKIEEHLLDNQLAKDLLHYQDISSH